MSQQSISRKQLLCGLILLPALALSLSTPSRAATTKEAYRYEDVSKGHDGKECKGCRWFKAGKTAEAKGSCSIVGADIAPTGWCDAWTKK